MNKAFKRKMNKVTLSYFVRSKSGNWNRIVKTVMVSYPLHFKQYVFLKNCYMPQIEQTKGAE